MAHDMQRQAADDEGDIPPGYMHRGNGHSGDMDRDYISYISRLGEISISPPALACLSLSVRAASSR